MARLFTTGYEVRDAELFGVDSSNAPGISSAELTIVRSGLASAKLNAGAGNTAGMLGANVTGVLAHTYFLRSYVYLPAYPGTQTNVLKFRTTGAAELAGIRVDGSGVVSLWNESGTPAQMGSNGPTLGLNTWYRLELSVNIASGAGDDSAEARVDGTSFAAVSAQSIGTVAVGQAYTGWSTAPGANKIIYLDDYALNDDQGAAQNSWPGSGKVVLLVPTADSAVGTGWVLGTGTAVSSNAFDSVNNTVPTGVADLAVGSDPKQIRNATSAANSAYDATMTTYTAAGVGASDTVNLVDPIVATAAPVVTSAKAGTVGVVSNPAITAIALGAAGTSGAFWKGSAGSTYATGWKISHSTITYAPTVTLGTAPVMRINQVTASTRIAVVCFMGIYVDYTPAAGSTTNQAVDATTTVTAALVRLTKKVITATTTITAALAAGKITAKTVAATTTITAALARLTSKGVAATTTITAALARKTLKAIAATTTVTAASTRNTLKNVAATTTFTAALALAKIRAQTVAATTTITAALTRQTNKVVAATTTVTASLTRQTNKLVTATTTVTAAQVRTTLKNVAATVTLTAALAMTKIKAQAVAATTTVTATVATATNKLQSVAATTTVTAALTKQANKVITATTTITASLVRTTLKNIAATTTVTAALVTTKVKVQAAAATTTITAALARRTNKLVDATTTVTADITRRTSKLVTATTTVTAALTRTTLKNVAATATVTATLAMTKVKALAVAATTTITAALTRQTDKAVDATATVTPTVTRFVAKRVDNTITITPDLSMTVIGHAGNTYPQSLDATVAMTADIQIVVIPGAVDVGGGSFFRPPGRLQPNLHREPPRKMKIGRGPVQHQVFLNARIMFSIDGGTVVEEEVLGFL